MLLQHTIFKMVRLTENQRLRIVHLQLEGKTVAAIAQIVKCSVSTVKYWISEYASRGNTRSIPSSGRPPVLGAAARARAVELLIEGQSGGSRFVARQLFAEGLTDNLVSPGTVLRHARQRAEMDGDELICRRGRPPALLTQRARESRIQFAKANRGRCWSHVMFTDRCKFHFRYPGSRVRSTRWLRKSKKDEDGAFTANHPSVYNVYGGVTRYGTTKLHPVTGTTGLERKYTNMRGKESRNITQSEYKNVLQHTLLKEGTRIFRQKGMACWTLQQDNDPAHARASAIVEGYNQEHSGTMVSLLGGWPGNSPDLSPIENLWGWVDAEVAKMGCQTFDEFKAAVDMKFRSVSKQMCTHLFKSMPERLTLCIRRDGGKVGY